MSNEKKEKERIDEEMERERNEKEEEEERLIMPNSQRKNFHSNHLSTDS